MIFIVQALLGSLGVAVARRLVPGVDIDSVVILIALSLLMGVVDATVRPVLRLLRIAMTPVAIGLFVLVVNAIVFTVAAAVMPGFSLTSTGSAVAGILVVSLVSLFVTWFTTDSLAA
jgi:putative membrane protein